MKVHPALKKATRKVALPLAFMIAITSMMMGFFVIPSYAEDGATPSAEPTATVAQKEAPAEEKPTVTPTEEKPATTPTETETSTKASKVTSTETPTTVTYKSAKDYITYECTSTGLEVQVADDAPNLRLSTGSYSKDVSAQEKPIIEPIPATLTVTVIDEPSNSDVVTIKCGTDPKPPIKVFVCKYVGKPGVDERLQTGNNPISVSVNAIPDYNGPGSYFADAQGRSYVLEVDNGQPEPSVSKCPVPVNLTKVTAVDGKFTDLCGLEFNLEFTPANTEGVKYNVVREGNTLKVTAQVTDAKQYELTNPEWSQTKTDELVKCPVVLKDLGFKKFESRTCTKVVKKLTISNSNDSQVNVFVGLPNTPAFAEFLLEAGKSKTVDVPKSAMVVQILAYPGATLDDAFYFEEVPFSVTSVKDCSPDDNGAPGEDNGDQPFIPAVVPAVMPDQPTNNWLAAALATALTLALTLAGAWQLGLVKAKK